MRYLVIFFLLISFSAKSQVIDTTVIGEGEGKCKKHDWYYNDNKTECICGKCHRYLKFEVRTFQSLKNRFYPVISEYLNIPDTYIPYKVPLGYGGSLPVPGMTLDSTNNILIGY